MHASEHKLISVKNIIGFIHNTLIGGLIIAHKIRIISTGYILFSTLLALFVAAHYGFFNLVHLWRDPAARGALLPFLTYCPSRQAYLHLILERA